MNWYEVTNCDSAVAYPIDTNHKIHNLTAFVESNKLFVRRMDIRGERIASKGSKHTSTGAPEKKVGLAIEVNRRIETDGTKGFDELRLAADVHEERRTTKAPLSPRGYLLLNEDCGSEI